MNWLLDTNAVSEPLKRRPNPGYVLWLGAQDEATLHVSTISLAEVWQGWFNLDDEHPDRGRILKFAEELPRTFRVLKFDEAAARKWGEITGSNTSVLPLRDSMIAAIAFSRGYRVVTRDEVPFRRAGCKVLNPWA